MSQKIKIVMPTPPNRANARGQTRYINFVKLKYFSACDSYWPVNKTAFGGSKLPARAIRYSGCMEVSQEMDPDNLLARFKWPLDWLVSREIIQGDKGLWPVNYGPAYQFVKHHEPRRLYLELEVEN